MKKSILFFALLFCISSGQGQDLKGKIKSDYISSASLQNTGGENPTRKLSVYLPPGYDESTNRYPVIYYLHGFSETDSLSPARVRILDLAISTGKIRPIILVISDQKTTYDGSFYTNSTLTGNWADFTAKDLVKYMDEHYRTIPNREARGIGGHSMGGHGAIRLGMQFPDIFSCVYALSPAQLALSEEYGPKGDAYKKLSSITTKEELQKTFAQKVIVNLGRTWSPNPSKPPFYCDIPFQYAGDNLIIDSVALDKWNKNFPVNMADDYVPNLKKLKALKLDWGRNDAARILTGCDMFSQKLEKLGIEHYAEEYLGNHFNKIWTDDGRILNEMLPFFNSYLTFNTGQKNKK